MWIFLTAGKWNTKDGEKNLEHNTRSAVHAKQWQLWSIQYFWTKFVTCFWHFILMLWWCDFISCLWRPRQPQNGFSEPNAFLTPLYLKPTAGPLMLKYLLQSRILIQDLRLPKGNKPWSAALYQVCPSTCWVLLPARYIIFFKE